MIGAVTTGWVVGWAIGAAVVVVVVVLLLVIITVARRIERQAGQITDALAATQRHTAPLWDVAQVNAALDRIAATATELRPGSAS